MTDINIIKDLYPAYEGLGFVVQYAANNKDFYKAKHKAADATDYYAACVFNTSDLLPKTYIMTANAAPNDFKKANYITAYKAKKLAEYLGYVSRWHDKY